MRNRRDHIRDLLATVSTRLGGEPLTYSKVGSLYIVKQGDSPITSKMNVREIYAWAQGAVQSIDLLSSRLRRTL